MELVHIKAFKEWHGTCTCIPFYALNVDLKPTVSAWHGICIIIFPLGLTLCMQVTHTKSIATRAWLLPTWFCRMWYCIFPCIYMYFFLPFLFLHLLPSVCGLGEAAGVHCLMNILTEHLIFEVRQSCHAYTQRIWPGSWTGHLSTVLTAYLPDVDTYTYRDSYG